MKNTPATPEQIARARKCYADLSSDASDAIEIDDNAIVSESEGGTWVQAWVWLPEDEW